jgi:hypothetical protein
MTCIFCKKETTNQDRICHDCRMAGEPEKTLRRIDRAQSNRDIEPDVLVPAYANRRRKI